MQCDKVIRELAVPTDERDSASLAEHLAQCPACARWADNAARFDRLWEATRPAEPAGDVWDTVWARVACAVDKSNPAAQEPFTLHASNLNGASPKTEESAVPTGRRFGFRGEACGNRFTRNSPSRRCFSRRDFELASFCQVTNSAGQ